MNFQINDRTTWNWEGARRMLGGTLVKIATPIVEEYFGDIYIDCEMVASLPPGARTFTYVIRKWGTRLIEGDDPRLVASAESMATYRQTWEIRIYKEENDHPDTWNMSATLIRSAA